MNPLLDHLNPSQQEAVETLDGPLLILAGPGSGKTRVVTHRIANMLQHGIRPYNILAMTFTNKAAAEMQERVESLVPASRGRIWISTFHKFCAWQLRKYADRVGLSENYTIYDTTDTKRLMKMVLDQLDLGTKQTPAQLLNAISRLKCQMIMPDQYDPPTRDTYLTDQKKAYERYEQALKSANAVDFDDLLLHMVKILRENEDIRSDMDEHYRYVLVDEYQDTNVVQYEIVKLLNRNSPNLAVTGDPDQSIYGWRGAEIRNILDFEKDYPQAKTIRLEANYRSTPEILHVADELIKNNRERKEKQLFTSNDHGDKVHLIGCYDELEEARRVADLIEKMISSRLVRPKDIAVFFRINALSRPFEEELAKRVIPYTLVNAVEFYQRKEVKDVLAYVRLLANPSDDVSFLRIVNEPTRGIGGTTVERLQDYAFSQGIPLLQATLETSRIDTLKARAKTAVNNFAQMMDRIFRISGNQVRLIIEQIMEISGYRAQFEHSHSEEDVNRLENLNELLNVCEAFDERHVNDGLVNPLWAFLEEVALVADSDKLDTQKDSVSLMTIHSAKGLEFPVVFITGCEDGLIPHRLSMETPSEVEEERRLLFVAVTRAKFLLYLTLASRRRQQGFYQPTVPSQFLMELPRDEMACENFQTMNYFDDEEEITDEEIEAYPDDFPADLPTGKRRLGKKSGAQGNQDGFTDEISDTEFFDDF